MKNPEMQNDPATTETVQRAKNAAQSILDTVGANSYDETMQSAVIGIEYSALTDHSEKALPTICIHKALGEFASKAGWDYTVLVGAQNPRLSRHARFAKDDSTKSKISFYDGRPEQVMTELEALAIAADLERAVNSEATE